MLHERMRAARKAVGKSQAEVADLLNVKRQTYSAYERGVSVPDAMTLHKLSRLFCVRMDDLVGDEPAHEGFDRPAFWGLTPGEVEALAACAEALKGQRRAKN